MKPAGPALARALCPGLLLLLLAGLAGCGTPGTGAHRDLRRSNWWNFYELGRSSLRAGDLESARAHFERCLGLRAGARFEYPVDRWRARTYGFHFIDNYFPNRELGITLLLQGDAAGAVPLLEKSLRQEPSDRARFHLARAHAAVAAARPGVALPVVRLQPPPAAVARREWTLAGRVAAEARLVSLRAGEVEAELPDGPGELPFSVTVPLRPGPNVIPVVARDTLGRETRVDVEIRSDSVGPLLTASAATRVPGGWRLVLTCLDESGLRSVRQGATDWLADASGSRTRLQWEMEVGPRSAPLEAVDGAGNRTVWRWEDQLLPDLAASQPDVLTAQAAGVVPASPVRPGQGEDRKAPVIRAEGVATTMVVHDPYFYLDGVVTDGGGLASLAVDGEEQIPPGQRGCASFRYAVELQPAAGTNRVVVSAVDLAGNRSEFAFTLAYFIPEYEAYEQRLRATVPPFRVDELEKAPADRGELLSSLLAGRLLRREEPRFRILERDGAEWQAILREQELSLSDLVDDRARLRLARLTPADLLLVGRTFVDKGGLTLFVQVVETVDGRVLFSEDVYTEDAERATEPRLAALASKLERRFPLLEGEVVEVDGKTLTLSLGRLNGVNRGARFLVIGPEGRPDWDEVKRHEGVPIEALPSRVSDRQTRAVVPAPAAGKVKEGDRVYSR